VGYRNSGKSRTLPSLTGGLHRNIAIGPRTFFIRRMSSDDDPVWWELAISQLDPGTTPHVIVTVCPTLEALSVLRVLGEHFTLFFWIICHSYDGTRGISPEEEGQLQRLGTIEVFEPLAEDIDRAARVRNFIDAHP